VLSKNLNRTPIKIINEVTIMKTTHAFTPRAFTRRTLLKMAAAVAFTGALSLPISANASQAQVDSIHFLVPGGAGGGWDGTARGTGEALKKSGLVNKVSFQNLSGGGGGKAIAYMIETAAQS